MIKETTNSLIINKLKIPEEKLKDINQDEGKIIEIQNEKVRCIQRQSRKYIQNKANMHSLRM